MQADTGDKLAATLDYFRKNSDTGLMRDILQILERPGCEQDKDQVLRLCMEIKSADLAVEVLDFACETGDAAVRKMLLEILWQINQDLSCRARKVSELLLGSADYDTAFHCYTILDNCCDCVEPSEAKDISLRLTMAAPDAGNIMRGLIVSAAECMGGKMLDYDGI